MITFKYCDGKTLTIKSIDQSDLISWSCSNGRNGTCSPDIFINGVSHDLYNADKTHISNEEIKDILNAFLTKDEERIVFYKIKHGDCYA